MSLKIHIKKLISLIRIHKIADYCVDVTLNWGKLRESIFSRSLHRLILLVQEAPKQLNGLDAICPPPFNL